MATVTQATYNAGGEAQHEFVINGLGELPVHPDGTLFDASVVPVGATAKAVIIIVPNVTGPAKAETPAAPLS